MYHSDEPVLDDALGHADHVENVAHMIKSCTPPFVIGIHGDWGMGKTSFLQKLRLYLAGQDSEFPQANEVGKRLWPKSYNGKGQGFETIWFEAWRYQFESNPIVALLQEIRSHFSLKRSFRAWSAKAMDEGAKLTYAALASIDEVTKHVGIQAGKIVEAGEKWEREQRSERLPSQVCRDYLDDAIRTLVGKKRRLVIFIDDLDRCQGPVAYRLLEAMKIYLSIPTCVFVLGLDWQHIKRAVAAELMSTGLIEKEQRNEALLQAADYLSKLCQTVHPLPLVPDLKPYLRSLMTADAFKTDDRKAFDEEWISELVNYDLLSRNPRKMKAFINALALYLSQLAPLVNGPIDKQLSLIVAFLRLNEDRTFRILESNPSFWPELVRFCRMGFIADGSVHDVFLKRALLHRPRRPAATAMGDEWMPSEYDPSFSDPADERVFRAAKLIREWRNGDPPTDDEFRWYFQLRQ